MRACFEKSRVGGAQSFLVTHRTAGGGFVRSFVRSSHLVLEHAPLLVQFRREEEVRGGEGVRRHEEQQHDVLVGLLQRAGLHVVAEGEHDHLFLGVTEKAPSEHPGAQGRHTSVTSGFRRQYG